MLKFSKKMRKVKDTTSVLNSVVSLTNLLKHTRILVDFDYFWNSSNTIPINCKALKSLLKANLIHYSPSINKIYIYDEGWYETDLNVKLLGYCIGCDEYNLFCQGYCDCYKKLSEVHLRVMLSSTAVYSVNGILVYQGCYHSIVGAEKYSSVFLDTEIDDFFALREDPPFKGFNQVYQSHEEVQSLIKDFLVKFNDIRKTYVCTNCRKQGKSK